MTDVIEAATQSQIIGFCYTSTGLKFDPHCVVCGEGAFEKKLDVEVVAIHYIVEHLHIDTNSIEFLNKWRELRRLYSADEMKRMR